jgi:peptide/nickel transport system substrate-binding protein
MRNSFYGFSKSLRGYVFSPRGPYNYSPGFGSIWKPRLE